MGWSPLARDWWDKSGCLPTIDMAPMYQVQYPLPMAQSIAQIHDNGIPGGNESGHWTRTHVRVLGHECLQKHSAHQISTKKTTASFATATWHSQKGLRFKVRSERNSTSPAASTYSTTIIVSYMFQGWFCTPMQKELEHNTTNDISKIIHQRHRVRSNDEKERRCLYLLISRVTQPRCWKQFCTTWATWEV